MFGELDVGYLPAMHFVRTIGEPHDTGIRVHSCKPEVFAHTGAPEGLNRIINDAQGDAWSCDFDHRYFSARRLVTDRIHHVRGLQTQQSRHLNIDASLGDPLLPHRVLGYLLAECHAGLQTYADSLQRHFRGGERAHRVMNASWAESPLCNFETTPLTQQQVFRWYPHLIELHFEMTMRCVVVTKY